jgi:hypothetical protein
MYFDLSRTLVFYEGFIYILIITVYHGWIQLFCFLLAHEFVARVKLEHIQVEILMLS